MSDPMGEAPTPSSVEASENVPTQDISEQQAHSSIMPQGGERTEGREALEQAIRAVLIRLWEKRVEPAPVVPPPNPTTTYVLPEPVWVEGDEVPAEVREREQAELEARLRERDPEFDTSLEALRAHWRGEPLPEGWVFAPHGVETVGHAKARQLRERRETGHPDPPQAPFEWTKAHGIQDVGYAQERALKATTIAKTSTTSPQPSRLAVVREREPAIVERRERMTNGAAFILDTPADVPAIWGVDERVAWADGEPLLICGPPGVGKTTLAQQLVLARIGAGGETLLGLPVQQGKRLLYLASDRPRQIARSFSRMVNESHREILAERLVVWQGPPPRDFASNPEMLLELAEQAEADTVVIDSLKDVALDLSKDESGSGVSRAFQTAVAEGINVAALHHQRKQAQGGNSPTSLADVYGSAWITASAGSVFLVWGAAGDSVVQLTHIKQPAADIGPLRLIHDHQIGITSVQEQVDLVVLAQSEGAITARQAAVALFESAAPSSNEIEKARARLKKLAAQGRLAERPGQQGGRASEFVPA